MTYSYPSLLLLQFLRFFEGIRSLFNPIIVFTLLFCLLLYFLLLLKQSGLHYLYRRVIIDLVFILLTTKVQPNALLVLLLL